MTALLWRDIEEIGRLAVVMLVVVLVTVGWVIVAGLFTFSPAQAFDFPPQAFTLDRNLLMSVGAASVLAMYSYGGYNQVCNIGDEIRDPTRTIPRSIVLSTVLVAALYILMTVVIVGMIPWEEVRDSRTVASVFIARTFSDPDDRPDGRHRDDGADSVRGGRVALRDDSGLLAGSVRGRARRRLLPRVRARARDEAISGSCRWRRSRSSRSRSVSSRSASS